MKNILVIGAGRSSSSLIQYFLDHAEKENWHVTVADLSLDLAKEKTHGNMYASAMTFGNNDERAAAIRQADIVVSMLPAFMHFDVAKECVRFKKSLVTASYVSPEIRSLDAEAKNAGIVLMNEVGLDPGIDHMSAMQAIDHIRHEGGELSAFYSYCGGLVAPESNDNPWGYKFSWNPRNVILAGQGTAQYIRDGKYKYLPYIRLFTEAETIHVEGWGDYDAYANRDSLSYRSIYGLENIPTMLRGTLRMPGFCKAWNAFVQIGLTDDTWKIREAGKLTYAQLLEAFLPPGNGTVKQRMAHFLGEKENSEVMQKLEWTGIFSNEKTPLSEASPAQILQELLERKWLLKPHDKDLVVMQHRFDYSQKGKNYRLLSSLVVKGEDQVHTAMAKTVGIPAAIVTKLILKGELKRTGVCVPVTKDIYEPVLEELKGFGISFKESLQQL